MLEETELKIRGHAEKPESIEDARKALAELHAVDISQIGHCIDGKTHSEFGRNHKFVAMDERTASGTVTHLALRTRGGSTEVIPHKYLASLFYKRTGSGEGKYAHFYLKR